MKMIDIILFGAVFILAAPIVLSENSYNWVRPANNATGNGTTYINNTYVNYTGGNPFDQSLNTTDNVQFVNLNTTGPVLINPPDGTADPLFQVQTTGANVYGWDFGTYDLTGLGYGKYPTLISRSNGALGDGLGLIEGGLIIGDGVSSSLGHSIGFLHESDFQNMLITAQWDYDGLGNNQMRFNDRLNAQNGFTFGGDLDMNAGATINVPNDGQINFIGQNGFDTYTDMIWNGGNFDLQFLSYTGQHFGFSNGDMIVGGGKLTVDGHGYNYIDLFDDSGDYRMVYSAYQTVTPENSGATAHLFTATGSNLPADGYMARFYHMADPGFIQSTTYWGDFIMGSNETLSDHDTYLKFNGRDNTFNFTYDQSEDKLYVKGNMNITSNLTITGELQGAREQFASGRQSAISADAYAVAGVGGTLTMSATQGYRAIRPGSIVGLSANLIPTAVTTNGTITIQGRVNDVDVFDLTITSNGTNVVYGYTTQTRGSDVFAAGDLITTYIDLNTFVGTITGIVITEEVVYDT